MNKLIQQAQEAQEAQEEENSMPRGKKRARVVMPTVTDSFEQVLEREVASSAGLMARADGPSIVLGHQVRHEVALPPGWNYTPIQEHVPQSPRAKSYPFTLDPFQQIATYCIERSESVLVSAHTSAGKTVVAEFAIATGLRDKQRVIYTSPIKALSNQKYRELQEQFQDVGLMTGEVTINPSASCLVMTTEILRSMLYRGSEVMREVSWVIFDEIHYMKDPERGVVWEETIILLPRNCHFVFLSATIPNAMQFAEWICKNKEQPCHVVSTNFRPTPLQHYLFAHGDSGLHLVVDEKGQFREESFQTAISAIGPSRDLRGSKSRDNGKENDGPSDIFKIVKMILLKKYYPVIVFSFSKTECEAYAHQVSKLEFNTVEEGAMVDKVVSNAVAGLSEADRTLPQITTIWSLLRRGIGVHHAGLLPILKEVIEILFQEGLLKILFATETFSIGLNMPARTVVFTSVQKFDGKEKRWITGGEYIQMSGRAGRRGLDERGIVIMMVDEKMEPEIAKAMVLGSTDPLNSAFRLTHQMILNLILVEGVSPEYLTSKSFATFQAHNQVPVLENKLARLEQEKQAIVIPEEESIASYHSLRQQLDKFGKMLTSYYSRASLMDAYLRPGRVVRIIHEQRDFGWGILTKKPIFYAMHGIRILEVLVCCEPGTTVTLNSTGVATGLMPWRSDDKDESGEGRHGYGDLHIVPMPAESIAGVAMTWMHVVKAHPIGMQTAYRNLQALQKRFQDGLPFVDLIEDAGATDASLKTNVRRIEILEGQLFKHPLSAAPVEERRKKYGRYLEKVRIGKQVTAVEKELKRAIGSIELKDLARKKKVLRELGYINHADVIELKGRAACEITHKEVLVLTEMLFTGAFNALTIPQTVALVSCFAYTEKIDKEGGPIKEEMETPRRMLQDAARTVARATKKAMVEIDEEEYVASFRTELMDVVYAWSTGATFLEICGMTEAFEGMLVRVFRLLEEQLRQLAAASRAIGNKELQDKFEAGIKAIKRDIVFAPSLYI
ncbi:ATP-dependent RNA helicase mtr4 [Podila epigama]|nr:ATP-dependent RNA helicase mtr4 [Podila epigama]